MNELLVVGSLFGFISSAIVKVKPST